MEHFQIKVEQCKDSEGLYKVSDTRYIGSMMASNIKTSRDSTDEWSTSYNIWFMFHECCCQQISIFDASETIVGVALRNAEYCDYGELVYILQGNKGTGVTYCSGLAFDRDMVQEIYDILVFEESKPGNGALKGHAFAEDAIWDEYGIDEYRTPYRCDMCKKWHFWEDELQERPDNTCPVCGTADYFRKLWANECSWHKSNLPPERRRKVNPIGNDVTSHSVTPQRYNRHAITDELAVRTLTGLRDGCERLGVEYKSFQSGIDALNFRIQFLKED